LSHFVFVANRRGETGAKWLRQQRQAPILCCCRNPAHFGPAVHHPARTLAAVETISLRRKIPFKAEDLAHIDLRFLRHEGPVHTLLDYLEAGESIVEFLAGFPSVSPEQVIEFLEAAKDRPLEAGDEASRTSASIVTLPATKCSRTRMRSVRADGRPHRIMR
jgi:hypothetical protein